MMPFESPRIINAADTFNALVNWFHDEVIVRLKAPGILVGLSGTDSLVTFLAAHKACEMAGKPGRAWGIHFAPSDDFLYDHPEAETHLWFSREIIPWIREKAPHAPITVDTSIDWRYDGLRWGAMADMSVVSNDHNRRLMRDPEDQYWVSGTRNRSEDRLFSYSNASMLVSMQPLIHLWKSEVLQISQYLGVPQLALNKSCETDCICGRERLPASHPKELDWILMWQSGELALKYLEENIPSDLGDQLTAYIRTQTLRGRFKPNLPYTPGWNSVKMSYFKVPLVEEFEKGTLNLKEFNHRKHLFIAWCYLKDLPFEEAFSRYNKYLLPLLEKSGAAHRFNLDLTRRYFVRLEAAMQVNQTANFDELVAKDPSVLAKITA